MQDASGDESGLSWGQDGIYDDADLEGQPANRSGPGHREQGLAAPRPLPLADCLALVGLTLLPRVGKPRRALIVGPGVRGPPLLSSTPLDLPTRPIPIAHPPAHCDRKFVESDRFRSESLRR